MSSGRAWRRGTHHANGLEFAFASVHRLGGSHHDHFGGRHCLFAGLGVGQRGRRTAAPSPRLLLCPSGAWFGGVFAACYLVASLVAIPRLGSALVLSLVLAGLIVAAL